MRQAKKLDSHTDYKTRRTTLALVLASAYLASQVREALREALEVVRLNNFDFERTDQAVLEVVYGGVSEEVLSQVQSEYVFVPQMGAIMDHREHTAHCALCGKGDSKDDGTNDDKLRYTFLLTNTAGGESLWVGSTCIVNYGLKVDGAATEEEAKAILAKTLRDHIAEWKKQAWRESQPQHVDIQKHYDEMCALVNWLYRDAWRTKIRYVMNVLTTAHSVVQWPAGRALYTLTKSMNTVAKFYARSSYLTPDKERKWKEVLACLAEWKWRREIEQKITERKLNNAEAEKFILMELAKHQAGSSIAA